MQHGDHIDGAGELFLSNKKTPVFTPLKDKAYLEKYKLNVEKGLENWVETPFLDGSITAVPCQHGHGWIHKVMANGSGFFIQLANEPSIYISGDTVLTKSVKKALATFKPDIAVLAAGQAQMDVGKPLLMAKGELLEFINACEGKVIANHMDALNHCPITRSSLKSLLEKEGITDKVLIPNDGQMLVFEK